VIINKAARISGGAQGNEGRALAQHFAMPKGRSRNAR